MNRLSILLLALFACARLATAQEARDTVALKELVVTATRVPTERAALAASVTVLQGDDLRRKGVRTVEEALRTVSGAALVQSGSYGSFASLFMRGGESDYVQVLIDGIQVNSPGEHFDFGNVTLENIERIEIVRGPGSVLYGSDAVTGVIQLITNAAAGRMRVDFAARGGLGSRVGATAEGTFGSGALDAGVRGSARGVDYSVGVSHFRTAGAYAFNNEHDNTGITTRVALKPDRATIASATLRYSTNTFHYPTDGSGTLVDANQRHTADAIAAGLDISRRLGARLATHVQLGFSRNDDSYSDEPDSSADTLGFFAFYSDERFERTSADVRFDYSLSPRSTVTLGGEYEHQRERGWNLSESEFGPFPGSSRDARWNRAAYLQLLAGASRVSVQAGARVEDNELFGSFATVRGGLTAQLTTGLRARVSAGNGFKEPRFFEQFATGFVRGNPDLQPEESRSIEGGADFVRGALRLSATVFAQRFRNLIQYVGLPPEGEPNYTNLAKAEANGLELEAAHVTQRLSLRGTLTLLDTRVIDDGTGEDPLFAAGARLIRRPRASGALSAAYSVRAFTLATTLHYVGERDDLNFVDFPAARVRLASYGRVDLSAEAPLPTAGWFATLKLENALNESYEEAHNFPARGRVVFLGVRYGR